MNNYRNPNGGKFLGFQVSDVDQIFICGDCEGFETLSLSKLGHHRQRCSLNKCGFTRTPFINWTHQIPPYVTRNHRRYLDSKKIITFRHDRDRLFCGLCDEVGRNFGFTPVGMFNHLRDSCGALDTEIRMRYTLSCHNARQRAQRRLRQNIIDEINPIEDDAAPPFIDDEPFEDTTRDNPIEVDAAPPFIDDEPTEETTRDNPIEVDAAPPFIDDEPTEETTRDNPIEDDAAPPFIDDEPTEETTRENPIEDDVAKLFIDEEPKEEMTKRVTRSQRHPAKKGNIKKKEVRRSQRHPAKKGNIKKKGVRRSQRQKK